MATLTSRTLATGVTSSDLIHIVITGDTSQNPEGSSYKATIGQVLDLFSVSANIYVTGGTYDNNTGTATFTNNQGSEFDVTGFYTGFTATNFGLFAQTGDSGSISATTVETSLINGGVGTMTVPANGFSVGDSFRADMAGVLNAANNQTIRIRVKTGSVILLDSLAQPISNITNDVWGLSINFTIRKLGGPGVGSIVSLGAFHYTKTSNGVVEGFSSNNVNNTTFDTTVTNTLDITVQWGSTNVGNNIYSDIFVLNKIY